jgi:hypothetical protein
LNVVETIAPKPLNVQSMVQMVQRHMSAAQRKAELVPGIALASAEQQSNEHCRWVCRLGNMFPSEHRVKYLQ